MDIYAALSDIPADFGPSAVTIGKFDGVHRGHKQVIEHLLEEAKSESLTSTVLTFDRNPLVVLAPHVCPTELVSNEQKLALLKESGVDATVVVEFTRSFSENSPREFVEGMLVNTLHAKVVLVGSDFKFGRHGAGNVAMLKELGAEFGFRVELLNDCDLIDSRTNTMRRVSSTWVREMLADGDVSAASQLLGHPPVVRSTVVRGAQRGRELGFPTANLAPDAEGFIPADGVYAAWAIVEGHSYRAAVSIGNNPTFDGVAARQVEAHLLGAGDESIEIDLYGKIIEVQFVERLRGMVKFDCLDALIVGITEDVARVRALLSGETAPTA